MWCIPAEGNAHFVCQMEEVLEVYKRPHDPRYPVVCRDETSVQCIKETRAPIAARPGQPERYDGEFQVADNHAAGEWAEGVRRLVEEDYADAKRITLVMDNLNTHTGYILTLYLRL